MWKAENASGGKRILLNYEVRYMQFESNSGFVVKKIGVIFRIKVRVH